MCAVYSFYSGLIIDDSGPKGYRALERACSPYILRHIALLPTSQCNADNWQAIRTFLSVMLQWIYIDGCGSKV